ncbi:MAG: response regulator [Clostridiaceae bacterium]|nr:response regulator [Clostridiaceae bacterium]
MIKALIVDDDFLVRMFLKQLIDWESQGFELIGDACGGEEALELIDQFSPDLIITDLSMPGMDGIELIEQARAKLPDSYIIALSCHGEFEYVKEAMKQGANEYVLKNLLDAPGLCKQLEIARTKLENAAQRAEQTDKLRHLAAKGTEMLRFELLQSLLHNAPAEEELLHSFREAGLDGSFHICAALAVSAETARHDALAQVCGQFCRNKPAFCLPYDDHACFLLLDLSSISPDSTQTDWVHTFVKGLYNCINEYLNVQPCLGVSTVHAGIIESHQAVSEARIALDHAFYDPSIHYAAELKKSEGTLPEDAYSILHRLPTMVEEGLYERISEDAQRILTLCSHRQAPPEEVKRWFSELLQILGVDDDAPVTFEACTAKLADVIQQLAEERGINGNHSIRHAAAYLREHFSQPISLSTVAAEVHLNPAYLSYLFKREMGVNFSDYLQNCRMEHMKLLLRESDAPLKECASQAGFSDYRNFCKLFKKQTGLRPAQYRSLNREN